MHLNIIAYDTERVVIQPGARAYRRADGSFTVLAIADNRSDHEAVGVQVSAVGFDVSGAVIAMAEQPLGFLYPWQARPIRLTLNPMQGQIATVCAYVAQLPVLTDE